MNKQRIAYKAVSATQIAQWERLKTSLEAPPGTEWVSIILYSNAGSAPGRVIWDHAALYEDQSYVLTLRTDRDDALYDPGDPVTFLIKGEQGGEPVNGVPVNWQLSIDGLTPLASGSVRVVNGVAHVTGSLEAPGFLRLKAAGVG